MRPTLLLPPRRSWPISAAAAGRAYRWKSHRPELPAIVTTGRLPDGRYLLRIAGSMPVVIGPALFAACTKRQRWELVRLLAVHAAFFCALRGLPMPWRTGCFVECGDEFVLEDEIDPYRFARLRVPRRHVVAGA